ncbi:MAG: substrate-binding domain-containing protein [Pyrinomonadaceae bacterium]
MKFRLIYLLIVSLLAMACGGPSSDSNDSSSQNGGGKSDKKLRIGFAMATVKEERWQRDRDAFEAHCKKVNVECVITVADNNSDRQANDVDNMLTQGVDVLVIAPQNATQAASMVDKAKAQGVKVISYDRLIDSPSIDLYISHQVPVIGKRMAEYALEKVPKGNYVMVYGAPTDNNALIMEKAQLAVLQPAIDRKDINIVASQFINDWKSELALNFVENALTQNSDDIQAIVVSNDGMAGGVVSALEKKGLSGKVLVTGQDAQIDALQRIAEGKQAMTVYKPIIPLASQAVEAAVKLAAGNLTGASPFRNDKIGKDVPAILLEVKVVDRSNLVDTVIKDGYAKFEEVYKNVQQSERPKQD